MANQHHITNKLMKFVRNHDNGAGPSNAELDMQSGMDG